MTLVLPDGLAAPGPGPRDRWGYRGHLRLDKYLAGQIHGVDEPYEVIEAENALMTAGATLVHTAWTGGAVTPFSVANARIGVGNGTTAISTSHTDLQGASKTRKALDSAPAVSGRSVQFVATFLAAEGNHAWEEVALFNAASAGTMLNRFLQSFGAKNNTLQWTLTVTCTL